MAEQVPLGAFPLMEFIGASSHSLVDSLAFFAKYGRFLHGDWHPRLIASREGIELRLGAAGKPDAFRHTNEFALGVLVGRLRSFVPGRIPLLRVHFRHRLTGEKAPYEDFFGVPVCFGREHDSLFFHPSVRTLRCRNSDSLVLGTLLRLADEWLETTGEIP